MANKSKIQWTEATWNPWHGCKKVSPGCKYCYMFRDKERYGHDPTTVLKSKSNFDQPKKWTEGKLIFTCSWSDWFIEEADQWRDEAWEIIRDTPQHTYQILTKRPERIQKCLPKFFDEISDRVWIGVSVESQQQTSRIKHLEWLPCIRFVSFEPLIGKVRWDSKWDIDWIIIGGESGNETGKYRYRHCDLDWIQSLVIQAKFNGVPAFVKQTGTYLSKELRLKDRHGGVMEEWPIDIRIREFPELRDNDSIK